MLAGYFVVWPNLKPEMRNIFQRIYLQLAYARDIFISSMATRLIGLTTTGIAGMMLSSRAANDDNSDDDSDPNAPPIVTTATTTRAIASQI